jgi:hypothetical protein
VVRRRRATLTLIATLGAAGAAGCETGFSPRARDAGESTAITVDDMQEITAQIADKLGKSDFLAARTPESPPLTITINKVLNYTSDVIRDSDRWYLMYRVIDSFSIKSLSKEKNISLVIPAERLKELQAKVGTGDGPVGEGRKPTHVMEATFRSSTFLVGKARTDAYYCQYSIVDVATGETAWSDRFEFKRAAVGRAYN